MRLPIPPEAAARAIAAAFPPLRCVADVWDYNQFVLFRVFDEKDEPLLRMDKITATGYGSASGLRSIIETARANLSRRGVKVEPWEMPRLSTDER
jgi:hypothetical protein